MMRTRRLTAAATVSLLAVALGTAGGVPGFGASALATVPADFTICPSDPSQPLTEPEALQSIDAYTTDGSAYAQQLATGSGVKVAVLGDGLDPDNPDFIRLNSQHVITDYQDFSGDGPDAPSAGTLSFGAASAIAAQGVATYDLSDFVNASYPLPAGCNIHILGVAPGASIVALRVGEKGAASVSSIVQAINYAVTVAHVTVIDEPFALADFPDNSGREAIEQSNDLAVAAGITVVEASGDAGPNGTIGIGAADPSVISVGASTDGRVDTQTGAEGARFFGNGQWLDDNDSAMSSGGVSQSGRTVDLVAPGSDNWGVCEAGFTGCGSFNNAPSAIQVFGGTEEASAVTAGAAALVISAYRSTHGGHNPTPAVVKQIISGTTNDLGVPPAEQGSGLLNADAATEAALTWPGATTSAPAGVTAQLVMSSDQLVLAGEPGTTASGTVDVRNVGTTNLTVAVGTRRMQTPTTTAQATAFNANTLPTYPDPTTGAARAYKQIHFSVPAGAAELTAHMAWAGTRNGSADALMDLTLLDPSGRFVGASEPQGGVTSPNWAQVEVQQPDSGTWTALMTSPAGASGYNGVVGLLTSSADGVPVGSVSPSGFTLKPNQSTTVTVHRQLPAVSTGDQSYALTIASSAGQQSAVSVIARPLLNPSDDHGSFSGVVLGGNAAPGAPAQTESYPITVPSNATGLDASVKFIDADSEDATPLTPGEPVEAMLIDPHGNLADLVSNNTLSDPDTYAPGAQIQSFVARPAAGQWLLVVAAANPVPGTEFQQDFTGQVQLRSLSVTSTGLPTSPKTVFKPGSVHTVTLHVTNEGVQPLLLGLDARTSKYDDYQPVPVTGQQTVTLPASASNEPTYSIPPDTRSFTVTASSNRHTQAEIHAPGGGIDAVGDLATAATSSLSSATATEPADGSFLVRGLWGTSLQEVGPFSDEQASGHSTLTTSLSTLSFDPMISAAVDDPYRDALLGTDSTPPIFLTPGQTTTITAHLTVQAARGASVSGLINLVTVPSQPTGTSTSLPASTTGEVAAALPFQYSVTPLPRLKIHAPKSVHRGKKLVVTVTHAGAPIAGATVHFAGHSKKTNSTGKATFTVRRHMKTGKAKIKATRHGYTPVVKTVTIKK